VHSDRAERNDRILAGRNQAASTVIITLSEGRLFAVMPGAMGAHAPFGAKLITVFHENFALGVCPSIQP
jgi:hypothetical protein